MDENINPFAMDPAQLEMIRGVFWFLVAAAAVYIASSVIIKFVLRAFVADYFTLNDGQQAEYKPSYRPGLSSSKN